MRATELAAVRREALRDLLYMAENLQALEDYQDDRCPTESQRELCGRPECNQVGCVVMKLRAAKAALRG